MRVSGLRRCAWQELPRRAHAREGRPRADLLARPPLASSRRACFDVREPAAHTRPPRIAPPPLAGRVATPSTAMPGSAAAVTPGLWVRLVVVWCGSVWFCVLRCASVCLVTAVGCGGPFSRSPHGGAGIHSVTKTNAWGQQCLHPANARGCTRQVGKNWEREHQLCVFHAGIFKNFMRS